MPDTPKHVHTARCFTEHYGCGDQLTPAENPPTQADHEILKQVEARYEKACRDVTINALIAEFDILDAISKLFHRNDSPSTDS